MVSEATPASEAGLVPAGGAWFVLNQLAVAAREHQGGDWGRCTLDIVSLRHGVGVEVETDDSERACARDAEPLPARYEGSARYEGGWPPGVDQREA